MTFAAGQQDSSQSAGHVFVDQPADRAGSNLEQVLLNSLIGFQDLAPEALETAWVPQLLDAKSLDAALRVLLAAAPARSGNELRFALARVIANIDEMLRDAVNEIIHQPRFQRLEASWRSLKRLVEDVKEGSQVKVKYLNVSWKELSNDMERAIEFDSSQLFKKVYDEGIGSAGGEPYGVLVGDYEIQLELSDDHPQDIQTLRGISGVAAAAFAPFITAANPSLLGLNDFSALERFRDFEGIFGQLNYLPWRNLRDTPDARFVGLTLPRVLVRLPYEDDGSRREPFQFCEEVDGPDQSQYLWGNAAYAFASVLIREFLETRWLARIRGVRRGDDGAAVKDEGGLVTNLPAHSFATDARGLISKISTDVTITDDLERSLSDWGFISLCNCKDTPYSAFYSSQSIQRPQSYDRPAAATNARMSAMLHYVFCVSRISHYLKRLVRDKTGTITNAQQLERDLHRWLNNYVTDAQSGEHIKARRPLREATVAIRELPASPGHFDATFHLRPHYELDELSMAIEVKAKLESPLA